jgi:hypothetical protein
MTRAAIVLGLLLTIPASAAVAPAVRLPLAFEENVGQTDASVAFLARGTHHTIFLTPTEIVFAGRDRASTLRVRLVGASPEASIRGADRLPGIVSYFKGNDPSRWHTGIPTYSGVEYDGVYPGVGLSVHTRRQHLEYDFTLAPGVDPGLIALEIAGADRLKLDRRGDLVARTKGGTLRQRRPLAYQQIGDRTVSVAAAFERRGRTRVAFRVGSYDRTQPLVIDPVLLYATYLGGNQSPGGTLIGADDGSSITVDAAGNAYVLGDTQSPNFPTAAQGLQAGGGGPSDVFVAKVNPSGSSLVYVAILGGSVSDYVRLGVSTEGANHSTRGGIVVDAAGNAYISGATDSSDFPTTLGAYDTSFNGPSWDAFVAKLTPSGSALVYSTFFGGTGSQFGSGLAVDGNGNAYFTGVTLTANVPLTVNAVDLTFAGTTEGFIGVLDASGGQLLYGSYLGGSGSDGGTAIRLDGAGNVVVAGTTYSADFPTSANALDTTLGGTADAFVTKIAIDITESDLVYSSYLGGSAYDTGEGLAVDAGGYAYVVGATDSTDFPVTPTSFDPTHNGGTDAFVLKLGLGGEGLAYGTFLGGGVTDGLSDIAVDATLRAYVAGFSFSNLWPVANPIQATRSGSTDAVVSVLSPGGDSLVMSTYLGGPGGDGATGIALDSSGNVYLSGTAGPGFPTFHALQPSFGGGPWDALIAKLHPTSATTTTSLPQPTTTSSTTTSTLPPPTCPASPDPGCVDVSGSDSRLIVREDTPGRESLLLRTGEGPALSATDLGDPALGGTAYVLCLYDESDTLAQSYVVDRAGDACGARPCWKLIGSGPVGGPNHAGYRYLDRTRAADGIKTLKLRATPAARVSVRGGNGGGTANLPLGATAGLQNATSATAQLRGSDAALCLSVTLGHVRRAGATVFVATD